MPANSFVSILALIEEYLRQATIDDRETPAHIVRKYNRGRFSRGSSPRRIRIQTVHAIVLYMVIIAQTQTNKLLIEVLREVREVRALVEPFSRAVQKPKKLKKLPKWLRESLKDVEEGRVYGPFNTVKELRVSLESNGA